jgi:hydroxymethylpyrimidine pyrophosphatase-like HAD family hydrolase
MSHRDWIATDLDGTLFARAFAGPEAVPATWRQTDEGPVASSWMPRATYVLMRALAKHFDIVAVTARDLDSFSRVAIEGITFQGAILANGAIMVGLDGELDSVWNDHMSGVLSTAGDELEAVRLQIAELSQGAARPRLVASGTPLPAYLVAKADEEWWQTDAGVNLLSTLQVRQCRAALLKNELQVLPPGVSKLLGLTAYQDRFAGGIPPLMGLGDMPADLEFMKACSFLGIPAGSKLEQCITIP